jgi:hypothetical protein
LSLVARGQIAIVAVPNRLSYCVIFIVHNLEMWPRAASWSPVHLYRMIREESSVFWEVIVLIIVRNKIRMNVCLIVNGYRD